MSSTYLELTNELLRELNEVALTSSTFASALGVQQHVKDSINRAYFDIITEEPQWPFLSVAESGAVDREKFIATLRSFANHAPHYLTEDLDDRVQSLASTLAALDVPSKCRHAPESTLV